LTPDDAHGHLGYPNLSGRASTRRGLIWSAISCEPIVRACVRIFFWIHRKITPARARSCADRNGMDRRLRALADRARRDRHSADVHFCFAGAHAHGAKRTGGAVDTGA